MIPLYKLKNYNNMIEEAEPSHLLMDAVDEFINAYKNRED